MKLNIKKINIIAIIIFVITIIPFENVSANRIINSERIPVYLTFDDGPSNITEEMLWVLKKKNIKATFFVVGKEIEGNEEILKEIYNEGHAIGLHTYTHKMPIVYRNENSFIHEMEDTQEVIYRVLGIKTNIIRFPGGSKPHLNSEFLDRLHNSNYKIYDWNVTVSDGIDINRSSKSIYREATKFKGNLNRIIILMHCSKKNKNTLNALEDILTFYDKPIYHFEKITAETKEYYFRFKRI